MTVRELFDFIVDPTIGNDSIDSYLEKVKLICASDILLNLERSYCHTPRYTNFRFKKILWQEEISLWRMKLLILCLCRLVQ